MSQLKHAQLPFRVSDKYWIEDAGGKVIALCCSPDIQADEAEYFAAFIVNACNSHYELLTACKAALREVEDEAERRECSGNVEYFQPMKDLAQRLRTAIAGARGSRMERQDDASDDVA